MDDALLAKFQQAYRDLDLFPLVEPDTIARFRVDYGLEVMIRLRQEIKASEANGKFVFAGHRGCGKSTLLKRLALDMAANHDQAVVFFSIADLIELSDITHTNILYAIALMLLDYADQAKVKIAKDIRETILGWNDTVKTQVTTQGHGGSLGVGGNWLQIFQASLQKERSFREELEKTFSKKISDLVGQCDRIVAAIQIATKQQVLVIIDDLDKLDLSLVEEIYRQNIKSLFSPQFRIVFTIPVSATQEPQIVGALNSEGIVRVHPFPVAKFFPKEQRRDPNVAPIAKTFQQFLTILEKRLPSDLLEPDIAREMVRHSGGVVRELVRIARECCTECMVQLELEPDKTDQTIDAEILAAALRNLRNDFSRQIGSDLYDQLVEIYETADAADTSDPGFVKLLHGLMVLEYINDALWYDVHPIVVGLLRQKGRLLHHEAA